MYKQYLGDGVYVDFNDAKQIVLTTEGGKNIIYLEPEVIVALEKYHDWLRNKLYEKSTRD